jgi:hypothetical protein
MERMSLRRPTVVCALTLVAVATGAGGARAADIVIVPLAPAAPVEAHAPPAPRPDAVPIDDHTARLIGARRLKLGILAFEYGLTDWLSFGTDPPEWAVRAFASILVPNLHVKGQFFRSSALLVSGQAGIYAADVNHGTASGWLITVPLTLYVSGRVLPWLWLHGEGAYNFARAWGSGDVEKTDVLGTGVARTAQVGAMAELRVNRVVAFLVRGRYQFYESNIVFEGSGMVDAYTSANGSLELEPLVRHPAMITGSIALTWKYVGVIAGGGYGHYFVPGANVALQYEGFTPEGALWAVF